MATTGRTVMIIGTVDPVIGDRVPRLSDSLNSSGKLALVEATVTGVGSEVSKRTPKTSSLPM